MGENDTVKPANAVFSPIARVNTGHDIDLNLNSVYSNSSALRRPGLTNDDSARQQLFGDCGSNVLGEMSNLDEVHICVHVCI